MKNTSELIDYLHAVMNNKVDNGVGRFYYDEPLALVLDNASKLAYFEATYTLDAVINDLLFDIRALGELDAKSLFETRAAEINEQAALNVERKLYPSDRASIWAKMKGYTVLEEAFRALGNDQAKGEERMSADGVPEVVHSPFNEEGILCPFVGLSWADTFGASLRTAKARLLETTHPIRVSSLNRARVRLTNQGTPERMDGLASTHDFTTSQVGMVLQLNTKLNLTLNLSEIEAFGDLPFQISRYAILQRLLAHVCGVEVGRFAVLAERVYRAPRASAAVLRFTNAIDVYERNRLNLIISGESEIPGDYKDSDFTFEFKKVEQSDNVTQIR